jgi:hypothetical protein
MKKSFILVASLLLILMSGCTTRMDREVIVPIANTVPVYVERGHYISCEQEEPVNKCSNEIRVVNYKDTCPTSCGFTVTERKISNCNKGAR